MATYQPRLTTKLSLIFALSGSLLASVVSTPVEAGKTNKTAIAYVRISESEGVVRVKPAAGIAIKAACQTSNYMVMPLSDPFLKLKLATLYTAAATEDAVVRLFGNDDCSNAPGSETITDITIFPPTP